MGSRGNFRRNPTPAIPKGSRDPQRIAVGLLEEVLAQLGEGLDQLGLEDGVEQLEQLGEGSLRIGRWGARWTSRARLLTAAVSLRADLSPREHERMISRLPLSAPLLLALACALGACVAGSSDSGPAEHCNEPGPGEDVPARAYTKADACYLLVSAFNTKCAKATGVTVQCADIWQEDADNFISTHYCQPQVDRCVGLADEIEAPSKNSCMGAAMYCQAFPNPYAD